MLTLLDGHPEVNVCLGFLSGDQTVPEEKIGKEFLVKVGAFSKSKEFT